MNDQTTPAQEPTEISPSFGQRLSSARRALNLSQEQVAAELRLKVSLIQALEEEDYSRLPTRMYIAGYLRNYARLLNVPVEPLLKALDHAQLESPPLISNTGQPYKTSHSRFMVKLFALVLTVVVIAGIISWIQSQDFAAFSGKPVAPAPQEPNAMLPALPGEPVEEAPVSEVPEAAVRPTPVPEADVAEPGPPPADNPARAEAAAAQAGEEEAGENGMPQTTRPEAGDAGVELVLQFSGDSWTEVTDSRGERLAYDLYREGQTKHITGRAPFKIFLGNAAAVTVEYNGQPYDFSAYVQDELARFQLGAAEDNKSNPE